jgi:hypothetical protein
MIPVLGNLQLPKTQKFKGIINYTIPGIMNDTYYYICFPFLKKNFFSFF